MTLGEFLAYCSNSPLPLIIYYAMLPITALLAWLLGRGEGTLSPWKYLYSALIYLSCIPGIFAIGLSLYLLLFERESLLNLDIYTQILPVLSMIVSLWLIGRNVRFIDVPGFHRIGGLMVAIAGSFFLMWLGERLRIVVFSYMPIGQLLVIFGIILLIIMAALTVFFSSGKK